MKPHSIETVVIHEMILRALPAPPDSDVTALLSGHRQDDTDVLIATLRCPVRRSILLSLAAAGRANVEAMADRLHLSEHHELKDHFARSRERFYCAEALREFARDTLPENAPFEDVQDQVYDTVVDTEGRSYPDGYQRVLETTRAAAFVNVTNHPLRSYLKSKSLQGICHQLANVDRLMWVRK